MNEKGSKILSETLQLWWQKKLCHYIITHTHFHSLIIDISSGIEHYCFIKEEEEKNH